MKVPFPVRLSSRLAFRAWFMPPPLASSGAPDDPSGLTPFSLDLPGGRLSGFESGDGPLVLALHGWGGRSTQFAELARLLAAEGYRVVVPDLPGRAGGEPTDPKQVVAVIDELVEEIGEPVAVVAHSFGALVTRLAFRANPPSKVVMFAPMLRVSDSLAGFADRLRLYPWVRASIAQRLRRWDPELFDRIAIVDTAQLPGSELLIIHDPEDRWASFRSAAELAVLRPGTRLFPLSGARHNRILRDPRALAEVAWFLRPVEGFSSGRASRSEAS